MKVAPAEMLAPAPTGIAAHPSGALQCVNYYV